MTIRDPSQAWTGITAHRRRDVLTILPMSLVAAAGSAVWLDTRLIIGWLVAICAFIGLNLTLGRWVDRTPAPSRRQEWLIAGVTFVYTGVYCLLPFAMAVDGARAAAVAGAAMLGAVALSSTAEFPISRPIGSASLLAVLLAAAAALLRPQAEETLGQSLVAFIAAAAFLAYVLVAALHRAAAQQRLMTALAVARDKEAEAAAANTAKTTFLATMSHEIRTPLNGVLGMLQVMEADPLSEIQRERLKIVRKSGEGLTAVLNDVLDLSKIEAGRLEIETVAFDLPELLVGCHHAFSVLAVEKGLRYTLTIAPEARGLYHGDPLRLRQVIGNLLSNAVKFTPQGGVDLSARLNDGVLEIAVSDTGVGVAPDNLDRLFGKFSQLDASSTRRHGGTGLGLAICRELCGLMGGAIDVASAVDHGSTFTVFLPADRLSAAPVAPARTPLDDPAAARSSPLRVLAAEDNHVNQLVLWAILGQAGIEPVVVANGAQAVGAWRDGDWDLVLMDVHMPLMDGIAATQEIRRREAAEGRARTPIIALTANAMSHQVQNLLAEGFDDHVAKPIDVATLFLALDRALTRVADQRMPAV
ncbi:signal transduction histidine kinase [Caulobacter sp. AP07]|uniref:ATP-binding protein n=1 Tax=Caulobacter sp. AP07 TaxID=1144304 RepID=UPI00027216CA|nr:ATP-binding protein [Caulobacter sp. AP07]EJL21447.1 signal transduction histidine kinase [Caulobacter sp. AP07]